MARPSIYTQKLADRICEALANGKSLRSVCLEKGIPDMSTIFAWIRTNEEFSKQYARACEERTEALAEEVIDLSDDASSVIVGNDKSDNARVSAQKLRVDTRRWIMSKMKPKKYGDKLDLTSDGKVLPTPILNVIQRDNSTTEDTEAK